MGWSMRRAVVGLVGVAVLIALAFLINDTARGQRKKDPPAGGPVPADKGGPPGTQPGVNDLADKGRITLPTDPKKKRLLEAVRDYIKSEDWETVAKEVQDILDLPSDVFVQMPVKQPDGKEVDALVGIRVAANRMLAGLPKGQPGVGLEVYKLKHGQTAKTLLAQAIADGDRQKFADVAQRFLWTDAGGEAAERLATILLDRGDFMAAAQAFDRLIQRDGIEKLEPLTLYKAAIAFNRGNSKEDRENKDKVWKQLQAKAPDGLTIGGQTVALDDAQKYLDRIHAGVNISLKDWSMVGGNASRSGQGVGDRAFMHSRWYYPLFSVDKGQVWKWIIGEDDSAVHHLERKGDAVIPAFAPVTATVTTADGKEKTLIVYRDYEGVSAIQLKTGKREWTSRSHWSMEGMLKDGGQKGSTLSTWVQQFRGNKPSILLENSTVGTMSSDGGRVYLIDDLQLPPFFYHQPNNPWGGVPQPNIGVNQAVKDGVESNKLQAISISSGKLFWELGGPRHSDNDGFGLKHDFLDSHFLGAPLCLGGKLYFLNEKKEEIRLVCLDAGKLPKDPQAKDIDEAIAWVQPLGTAKEKLLADYGRRINATHIAYGEGTLVCPTNAGVILGVDLLTHSLLWAHTYADAPAPPTHPDPYGGGFRGRPVPIQPQPGNAPLSTDWKAAPPIIADGKVVFTAPDGPELRCLNLRNGAQIWGLKRSDGDVYLGGVYAGRVIIVGKKDVRALSLDDARELWRVPTGMPSGRGVASGNVYYVPLREATFSDKEKGPGIFAIDVERGKVVAQTRSKLNRENVLEVPGNLTFFDGEVISQSATEVVAYPQLKVKLDEMNARLEKNKKDPEGLYSRGELRLDQGERVGAVEDLRAALANGPDATLKTKAEAKLFDAMTELLKDDFGSGEKYLEEYAKLCVVSGAGDEAAKETQRRKANYLCLVAQGREGQGKLEAALNAYLDFGKLPTAQDELLSVVTEPAVKARPDVWARGRIKAMLERSTPEQRKPLEDVIARKWTEVKSSGDIEELRHFVSMFGDSAAIGKEGQLYLAERLMERPGTADMVDAEMQFMKLANDDDEAFVARALDGLARLCTRKGRLGDAYHYYHALMTRFPDKEVRDGKTGTQLLEGLATDKRFLQFMDDPGDAVSWNRFKGEMERDKNFSAQSQHLLYSFEPINEPLPALRQMRVAMNPGTNHFKVVDRRDGKELVSVQVSENFNSFMYPNMNMVPNPGMPVFPGGNMNNQMQPNRFGYHSVGHLVVANVGQFLVAVDAVTHRKLWDKNLLGDKGPSGGLHYHAESETLDTMFADGTLMTVAQGGPVAAGYVTLLTRDGLAALDPLTGKPLWVRNDVSAHARLFGDDRHIYLVELNNAGAPTATRAFRAQDGSAVPVPDFAALYQKKERITGREMLVADNQSTGLSLRLYDVLTGKDLWSQKFPSGSTVLHSEAPDLAGVLSPDGRATVVSLSRRKVVNSLILTGEHMKNLKQAHLLADAQHYYIATTVTDPANPNNEGWENIQSNTGLRDISVNGFITAFHRSSGKFHWANEVAHQKLVLEQYREMPILLFTARYQPGVNVAGWVRQPNQVFGDVYIEAYDKRTGKLFYKMPTKGPEPSMGQNYPLVYAINHDAGAGKVEMIANNYKLTISPDGDPTTAKADGVKGQSPRPGTPGGGAQQGGSSAPGTPDLPRVVPAEKVKIIKD
jgi:outer membrane protein assembly factor BamB/tetratricopeptide (TPR) repeat protein